MAQWPSHRLRNQERCFKQTTPTINKIDELDDRTAQTTRGIRDTDQRAQQGIQAVDAKASAADQKALAAGQQADQAQQLASNANTGVNDLTNRVINSTTINPVTEAAVHFGFNKADLSPKTRSSSTNSVRRFPTSRATSSRSKAAPTRLAIATTTTNSASAAPPPSPSTWPPSTTCPRTRSTSSASAKTLRWRRHRRQGSRRKSPRRCPSDDQQHRSQNASGGAAQSRSRPLRLRQAPSANVRILPSKAATRSCWAPKSR